MSIYDPFEALVLSSSMRRQIEDAEMFTRRIREAEALIAPVRDCERYARLLREEQESVNSFRKLFEIDEHLKRLIDFVDYADKSLATLRELDPLHHRHFTIDLEALNPRMPQISSIPPPRAKSPS